MATIRTIKIFRINDAGVRVPWVMELDHERTLLHEYAEHVDVSRSQPPPTDARAQKNDKKSKQRMLNGLVARWGSVKIKENPIPGTDDLRAKYWEELEEITRPHAQAGRECPGCELGAVMRRYRALLQEAGHLDEFK